MLKTLFLLDVLKHPIAAHVILMTTCNTKETSVICDDCSTEFGNVLVEINKEFRLFAIDDIVEVNVLVAPFEIVNDSSVCQLLLHDEKVLKEFDNVLFDVNMRIFRNHCCFLRPKILLIFLNQNLSII